MNFCTNNDRSKDNNLISYKEKDSLNMQILDFKKNENIYYVDLLISNDSKTKLYFPLDHNVVKFLSDRQKEFNICSYYAIFRNNNRIEYSSTNCFHFTSNREIINNLKKLNEIETHKYKYNNTDKRV